MKIMELHRSPENQEETLCKRWPRYLLVCFVHRVLITVDAVRFNRVSRHETDAARGTGLATEEQANI